MSGPPRHAPTLPTLIAATTTFNLTSAPAAGPSAGAGAGALEPGTGRLFLSHWDASGAAVNHSDVAVTITIHCGAATPRSTCPTAGANGGSQVYLIDESVAANQLWASMGSPAVPTAAQLEQLKARSELKPKAIVWTKAAGAAGAGAGAGAGSVLTAEIVMPPNTAGVITLV